MVRFADALRWVLTVVASVLASVFTDLGKDFLSKVLGSIAEMPGFYPGILILIGATAGVWLVWLVGQFDGHRARERKQLGQDFLTLASSVERVQEEEHKSWPHKRRTFGELQACSLTAPKYRIWTPGERIFDYSKGGPDFLATYLIYIGTKLSRGHFKDARREAHEFEKLYQEHFPEKKADQLQRQPSQQPQQTMRRAAPPANSPKQLADDRRLKDLRDLRDGLDEKLAELRSGLAKSRAASDTLNS
jgi:hypothetical protein